MTPQQIFPLIGATISMAGIIFQTGKHADKLDILWSKVEAQEKKEEYMNSTLYEIKGDLKTLGHDITSIKEDICEIKDCWKGFNKATFAVSSGNKDLNKEEPIIAKSIKFLSLHSIFAPKSKTTLIPFLLGHKPDNAGLSIF